MAIVVTINGVDRTRKIAMETLRIDNILTRKRDSCRFRVNQNTGDPYVPNLGEEIIITLNGSRVFGGIIVERDQRSISYGVADWTFICDDYTRLLDRRLIPNTYENVTVNEILADIQANYMPAGFTVSGVNCPVQVKYVRFNYVPISKAIEQLAEITGYDWFVDYNKDINFFSPTTNPAPVDIEDNNGSHEYESLVVRTDNSQIKNSIVVRGGEYKGFSFTGEIEADGSDRIFRLPYKFSEFAASVTGEPLDVGIDNIDDENLHDALYNFNEKILKFKETDKPSSGAVLRYSGLPHLPVIVKVKSQASIESLSAAEGGDGLAEYLIVDKSINSKEGARQRALAEIQIYATTLSEGEFRTELTGFRAGQRVRVNSSARGVDSYFIINKVTLTQWHKDSFIYDISLVSTKSFDFIDLMMRMLLAETKKIEIAEDETVDILDSFEDDLTISDDALSTTTSEGPYLYDSGLWGFSTWT